MFIIRLIDQQKKQPEPMYFSSKSPWKPVPREQAEECDRRFTDSVCKRLKRFYLVEREEL